jgi:hypothetical protein
LQRPVVAAIPWSARHSKAPPGDGYRAALVMRAGQGAHRKGKLMPSVPQDRRSDDLPEVDPGGPVSDLAAVRILIDDHVERLAALLHYTDAVPAGRQWTVPIGLDCGFDGDLVIRIRDAGDCERAASASLAVGRGGGR